MTRRTLLIGDVHGCLDELHALLARVGFERGADRVVFLGDLLDRGPDPVGCVQLARELGADCVLGNHEEKHLRYRRHERKRAADPAYVNPMRPMAEKRLREHAGLSEADWAWLESRPKMLEVGFGIVAVHAGVLPRLPLEKQPDRALLRLRFLDERGEQLSLDQSDTGDVPGMRFWTDAYDGPVSIAHGHAVRSRAEPVHTVCPDGVEVFSMDTGCVFGGRLSALVLEAERPAARGIVQVDALREYVPIR